MRFLFLITCLLLSISARSQNTPSIDTTKKYCWRTFGPDPDFTDAPERIQKPRFSTSVRSYRLSRRLILPATLSFVSGASWGLHETVQHRNETFFRVFPGASQRFFGPQSWKNKYWGFEQRNGRNRTPIYFTDALHLSASTTQVTGFFGGCTIMLGEDRPVIHYVLDAVVSFAAYSAGNVLVYNVLFR